MDRFSRRHHSQQSRRVLQLTHIARPVKMPQLQCCLRQQLFRLFVQLCGCRDQKFVHQQRNIFPAFTQGRNVDANHIEPMHQIFTKQLIFHQLLKILMRRGNHTHINLDRLASTHAIEFTIGQYAQQTCLQIGRHVPDLIQKQGACVSLFKTPGTAFRSAGKSAAFMPEQFGLQ